MLGSSIGKHDSKSVKPRSEANTQNTVPNFMKNDGAITEGTMVSQSDQ